MNNSDFQYIQSFIKKHTAIALESDKEYLVESRLSPIAKEYGFASVDKLVTEFKERPTDALKLKIIDAIATNETLFFRDVHPFDVLKQNIIPELVRKRGEQRTLSIWCAAASSGQEPYTIAMILKELSSLLDGWRINFIASDISEKILIKAEAGVYSQLEVNRGLPLPYLLKYFDKEGTGWRIKKNIRDMVRYQKVNVIQSWPVSHVDLIFMRNLLIYFDLETKKEIFKRMAKIMALDGYLFLGGAETILGVSNDFERSNFNKVPCYQLKK